MNASRDEQQGLADRTHSDRAVVVSRNGRSVGRADGPGFHGSRTATRPNSWSTPER